MVAANSTSSFFTLSASSRDPSAAVVTRLFRAASAEAVRRHVEAEALGRLWLALKIEPATPREVQELIEAKVRVEIIE